jgi:hypothetical protein
MSGDHNMNQSDPGWRKRQIALDKKAENARELGLDYEPDKTVIEMAREAKLIVDSPYLSPNELVLRGLENLEALVRADERNSWPAEMEAMEQQVNILTDALAAERDKWMERTVILIRGEREACAKVCDEYQNPFEGRAMADAIRARGNT